MHLPGEGTIRPLILQEPWSALARELRGVVYRVRQLSPAVAALSPAEWTKANRSAQTLLDFLNGCRREDGTIELASFGRERGTNMMMAVTKEVTGVMHDPVIKGRLLTLKVDCEGALEANQCTWSHDTGKYRIAYTSRVGGVDVPGRYYALRRELSGFGRHYWDAAIPAGDSKPRSKHPSDFHHTTITSAMRSLEACYEQDMLDAYFEPKTRAFVAKELAAMCAKKGAAAQIVAGMSLTAGERDRKKLEKMRIEAAKRLGKIAAAEKKKADKAAEKAAAEVAEPGHVEAPEATVETPKKKVAAKKAPASKPAKPATAKPKKTASAKKAAAMAEKRDDAPKPVKKKPAKPKAAPAKAKPSLKLTKAKVKAKSPPKGNVKGRRKAA